MSAPENLPTVTLSAAIDWINGILERANNGGRITPDEMRRLADIMDRVDALEKLKNEKERNERE